MISLVKRNALVMILGLMATSHAFAANMRPSVSIPVYFSANCQHLTGTWLGNYTDPQDLLVDRAVRISIQAKGDHIVGNVTPLESGGSSAINGQLWATCHLGLLSHVFVGAPKQCGHFAPAGGLVAANMLILYLPYENAMTGTNVLTVLHRENNQYTGATPAVVAINNIKTCH